MQITRYGKDLYAFPNGLVIYSGAPSEADPLERDPFCWYDLEECKSYVGEIGEPSNEVESEIVDLTLEWLKDNYHYSDAWDRETADLLEDVCADLYLI